MADEIKKPIKEKTIDFVKTAVTKMKGVVELKPGISKFPSGASEFSYRFLDDESFSGSFSLSGEETKASNTNIFEYLYKPQSQTDVPDLLLPKCRFVTKLLNEVFDRYSILSHRVGKLTTPLTPAPVFAPKGTNYLLLSDGSQTGKSSVMTVIEAHMSVECKLGGKIESFIDIMVCDEKGNPVSAEQQIKYLRRRNAMIKDFDSAQSSEIKESDQQFFRENLNDILHNVMNGWKQTLSYPRDNKLGQYFQKMEKQFNYELAAAKGRVNPDIFRPTVELKLLSLYYLQTPCVDFVYQLNDSLTQQALGQFELRVNRNDNKTVFRCGVCENDFEVSSQGQQLYICAETGEIFAQDCKPIKCTSCIEDESHPAKYIHPGNQHKKWKAMYPALNAPPKNCLQCDHYSSCFEAGGGKNNYVCSDHFHVCGEQGCKTPVCENLVVLGKAVRDHETGVYFCSEHMHSVCQHCGKTVSSERLSTCSCGKVYCLDCATQHAAVCSSCGKTICTDCGLNFETDSLKNKTGTVLCSNCTSTCQCGSVVGKNQKRTCAICHVVEKCNHCQGENDFFDVQQLSENKKQDVTTVLSLKENAHICSNCVTLCPGDCKICPQQGDYCAIKSTLSDKVIDRTFPIEQSLWQTCSCCGENYPHIYMKEGKCLTCHSVEDMLNDKSKETVQTMRDQYVKHKNKVNIIKQFQLGWHTNAIAENHSRLIFMNRKKLYILNKSTGKGVLIDREEEKKHREEEKKHNE